MLALLAVLGLAAMAFTLMTGTASAAATKPAVQKDNDANHDGVYSDTENVPKDATYPFTVTYRLTITAGSLPHVLSSISDPMGGALISSPIHGQSCAPLIGTTIAANSTTVCYYDVTLAAPSNVPLVNTATIDWDNGGADTASNTSTVEFPSLSLVKSSTVSLVTAVGQVVPYSYAVTNTGTDTVTGIAVSDDNTDAAPSCPQTSLTPGASMTCTAQHTVTAAEIVAGAVDNMATASSNEAANVTSSLSIPTITPVKPSIVKDNDANHDGFFSDTETVAKGATYPLTVTYRLTLDAGTLSHTIAGISDTMTSTLTSSSYSPSCASLIGTTIAATTSEVCYYEVTLAGPSSTPLVNTATFTWDNGGADTASDTSTVNFASLSLQKSSSTTLVTAPGQVVPYSYVVTNTGTVAVTGINLSDNNTDSAPACPQTSLAAGASMTCTGQHTATAADLVAGSVKNVATASSTEAADVTASLSIPTVSVFSAGGTFVVGDLTVGPLSQAVGKSVTFWGAQWWKLNSLSGGTGPAAFKGFEDSPAVPMCGVPWTSRPGNSTPPPTTIPGYMLIIVSSQVTKNGPSISGDIPHLVLVKTDPGYAGNPGHAGTGTIVGVVC